MFYVAKQKPANFCVCLKTQNHDFQRFFQCVQRKTLLNTPTHHTLHDEPILDPFPYSSPPMGPKIDIIMYVRCTYIKKHTFCTVFCTHVIRRPYAIFTFSNIENIQRKLTLKVFSVFSGVKIV